MAACYASWLVQLMVLKNVINHTFLDFDGLYIFVLHNLLTFFFFLVK